MSPRMNRRLDDFTQSDLRAMTRACRAVGGINLAQGLSDLPTHPLVQEGAIEAIRAHHSTYSPQEGIPELREAIARKMRADNRLACDPETEVVVTAGATGGFTAAAMALLDPGDEMILFEPYYPYHRNALIGLGAAPIAVRMQGDRCAIDDDALAAAVTDRTKAIVVCNPANPPGKVFRRDELERIARLCVERDLFAITDEIYEYYLYDGNEHVSLATLPGMRERTITISGFSKTFRITGWRLGYVVAVPEIARRIGVVNDAFYVCAPTPLQYGAARGLGVGRSYYVELRESYQRKRDLLARAVEAAGMRPLIPEGCYYLMAEVSRLGWGDARTAARKLLDTAGVAAVPGRAFYDGDEGDRWLRFCFAKEDAVLEEAARRLERVGRM
ncbi:MAG: aminotransferase class I/II-fold pyridoxal phosphate-dependent enzyme [Candidatus Eisenbacteria bacterium]|nr:aminotransferase class I/II-fold pyridoxal phosphate-dependent enzyme [Candidatus Latescibacterota bacterium]MBD3301189.1 aminotransferase class I/II-fold pyridoxal phosphate-dependent enzyme [Candidatus Eisenbacteria bacterium]